MRQAVLTILFVWLAACAREAHDVAPAASASASPPPPASTVAPPAVTPSAAASVSEAPPDRHGECCTGASDCGERAACARYPFNVTHHCPRVCRDKCKRSADCPPRGGSPSSLSCGGDGLCEVPSPGN